MRQLEGVYINSMASGKSKSVALKQEAVEAIGLEERIIELCEGNPEGITDVVIVKDQPSVDAGRRATAINRLLSTGAIELAKQGSDIIYRLKGTPSTAAAKTKGFETEEKVVYQVIEQAQNKGIWIRDIRFRCNLGMTQLNKTLKTLESKKLIKAVKSVAASKKKVYMLYNIEPDQSVTGGAWYSDQDFESEFVEVLNEQCYKYLQQKRSHVSEALGPLAAKNATYASSKEIWQYISQLGISKVELSVEDIEMVLDTVVFDGRAEMSMTGASQEGTGSTSCVKLYRAISPLIPPTGLMRTPCGVCPVSHECSENGLISPRTCIYMNDWLKF